MGQSQISREVQIFRYNRETWSYVMKMTVAQMDYSKAMTYNQRFLEREEQLCGVNSDFARRKAEHEALSKRLEEQSGSSRMRQRQQV